MEFCALIQRDSWSVRETERRIQEHIIEADGLQAQTAKSRPVVNPKSEHVGALEQEFRRALGTKVDIKTTQSGRGRIVIHFKNHEEYDRLRAALIESES